jgi:hypothetical protein
MMSSHSRCKEKDSEDDRSKTDVDDDEKSSGDKPKPNKRSKKTENDEELLLGRKSSRANTITSERPLRSLPVLVYLVQ